MAGTIQEFLGTVNKLGMAKDSYFEVTFFTHDGTTDTRLFSLMCHQASIPGYKIKSQHAKIYGLPYQVPTGIEYDPFYCSFYVDNTFSVPSAIYKHRDEKLISQVNYSPKYRTPESLMTVVMTVFDGGNKDPIAAFVMADAYVDAVQSSPMSWGSHNSILNMTMNIAYERLYEVVMDFTAAVKPDTTPETEDYKVGAKSEWLEDGPPASKPKAANAAVAKSEGGGVVGFVRNAKKDLTGVIRTATTVRNAVTDVVSNIVNPIREYTSLAQTTIGAVRDAAGSIMAAPNQIIGEVKGVQTAIEGTINSSANSLGNFGNFF